MADKTVFSFAGAAAAGADKNITEGVADLAVEDKEGSLAKLDLTNSEVNCIIALKLEHEQYMAIDAEYKKERVLLEKKYFALKSAVWEKRSKIISGEIEVEQRVPLEAGDEGKGSPSFWASTLSSHPIVGQLITEEDAPALLSLKDIRVEYNDDYTGFTLIFVFGENEFFTNTELRKTYEISPDLLEERAPELNSVEGSEINWKAGKNLCVTETKKKQKAKSGRNAGQVRYVTKTEPKPSFFHYFSDPRLDEDEEEDDEEGEQKDHGFTLTIDEDYEVAHAIRVEVIPEAVLWFTGEAQGDDEEYDEDGEEGDDEEGDDEEGDDEEDGEDGDVAVTGNPAGGFQASGGTGGAAGTGPDGQPECKQS